MVKPKMIRTPLWQRTEVPLTDHARPITALIEDLRQEGFIPGDEARVHSYAMESGKVLAQVPAAVEAMTGVSLANLLKNIPAVGGCNGAAAAGGRCHDSRLIT